VSIHTLNSGLLAAFSRFPTEDTTLNPSVLLQTMFQPTLDKPWRQTYAWTDQLNGIPLLDGPTSHDWYNPNKSLATSMWNTWPQNGYLSWSHRMHANSHQLDQQC